MPSKDCSGLTERKEIARRLTGIRQASEAMDDALAKAIEGKLMTACVYLHSICKNSKWVYSKQNRSFGKEFEAAFLKLLDLTGKRSRAEKVFEAMISDSVENGRLDLISIEELVGMEKVKPSKRKNSDKTDDGFNQLLATCSPFNYKGRLEQYYAQDKEINERAGWRFETPEPFEIKLARAIFAGDRPAYSKALEFVFFDDSETIDLNRKIEVPSDMASQAIEPDDVRFICEAFELDEAESRVLQCSYNISLLSFLNDCLEAAWLKDDSCYETACCNFAALCDLERNDVSRALGKYGKLVSYGLVSGESGSISSGASDAIVTKDLNMFFCDVIETASERKTYPIDSFQISEDETELLKCFLKSANPVNILLYGPPGTGKTEYAYAIAKECGLQPVAFKNEAEISNSDNRELANCRLRALMPTTQEGSVIIIDEAENVLRTKTCGFPFIGTSSAKKGIVNKMLDSNRNKVIWILNYTSSIDSTTLRRMTYSVNFPKLSSTYLMGLAKSRLDEEMDLDSKLKESLVGLSGRYRVSGASLGNMIKTLKAINGGKGDSSMTESDMIKKAEMVFKANSTLLYGRPRQNRSVGESYDIGVLNTSFPAEKIVSSLKNIECADAKGADKSARLLFYGVTGAGKTEFARYISEQLDKPLILKKCSDILDQYVGNSEKNIMQAFQEAEHEEGILLFDEADSFLSDRVSAHHSWERTQVNEFLMQMEEYKGILICTTNLRDILDPAMARRFHFLVEFKPLERPGVRRLLELYYPDLSFSDAQLMSLDSYESVTPGDFGQLHSKCRFYAKNEITSESIMDELIRIQNEKKNSMGHTDRIGF